MNSGHNALGADAAGAAGPADDAGEGAGLAVLDPAFPASDSADVDADADRVADLVALVTDIQNLYFLNSYFCFLNCGISKIFHISRKNNKHNKQHRKFFFSGDKHH